MLAPTWYVQLAPLTTDDPSLASALSEARQVSQERRKRELAIFLQEMSRRRPMVIFLDDIHWADPSSVDLLAYLGSRCSGWHLLLILTYRPSDLLRSQHPFGPVKLELQGRGICREIALPFLRKDDLAQYLSLAFEEHRFPAEFAAVLHARTEGNPLFVVDLLHYLRDSGVIVQDNGHWTLAQAVTNLEQRFPESVRGMIQRKIDQLSTADRYLLMAASIQGPEFDSAVVAQLLEREPADIEERLDVLERVHFLVKLLREEVFPDGTIAVRYGFVHALYQNALYAAVPPTRKAAWSAAAANSLLTHYGDAASSLAAELAMLFEAARDSERAASYYQIATNNAARIFAHHEGVVLARRGLSLLESLPPSDSRAELELPLLVMLGMQVQIAQGYGVPEAERIYARARKLCQQLPHAPLFPILWGLWMFYEVGGQPWNSRELAEQLFALSQTPDQFLQARQALTITALCLGNPFASRHHMEEGIKHYDPTLHSRHTYLYGQDPGVGCLAFGAIALWLLGYPDQAVQRSREGITFGAGQPSTQVLCLQFSAMLHQYRREEPLDRSSIDASRAIANEQGFSFWKAGAQIYGGWALAQRGSPADGLALLRQGLAAFKATGAYTYQTYYAGIHAEALAHAGQFDEALQVLELALAHMHSTGETFHGAELHRLQGEFLLQQAGDANTREAENCFHLPATWPGKDNRLNPWSYGGAAMSLTRLNQKQNRNAEARRVLTECYEWFTEGFDTPDLKDAKVLLQQLA